MPSKQTLKTIANIGAPLSVVLVLWGLFQIWFPIGLIALGLMVFFIAHKANEDADSMQDTDA